MMYCLVFQKTKPFEANAQFSEKSMDINFAEPQVKFWISGETYLDISTSQKLGNV